MCKLTLHRPHVQVGWGSLPRLSAGRRLLDRTGEQLMDAGDLSALDIVG